MSYLTTAEDFSKTIMDKNIVIFDADGVLVDFYTPFFDLADKKGYIRLQDSEFKTLEDILSVDGKNTLNKTFGIEKANKILNSLIAEQFSKEESVSSLNEIYGAKDSVDKLLKLGFTPVCVTNLPSEYAQERVKCFNRIGIHIPIIINRGPKTPVYKKIREQTNKLMVVIDDCHSHAVEAVTTGVGELDELSSSIMFLGGGGIDCGEKTHISSRLTKSSSWEENIKVLEYYLNRFNAFSKIAESKKISTLDFIKKYIISGKISYSKALKSNNIIDGMKSQINHKKL